jgi:acetolactate synthase I/II/III large subunit
MNGARRLMNALADAGLRLCLTNPGTTEIHLVAALAAEPRIRTVLGLFEGVCSGAADGFARMTGMPAAALFHLGPGLGNALANLHNARRARTPIVTLVGDHAGYHRVNDPPLASDIAALARPVSGWVREAATAEGLANDGLAAVQAALQPPGQIATLVIPADCAWGEAPPVSAALARPAASCVADQIVDEAARLLRRGLPTALLLGGSALREPGLQAAARIARKSGAEILSNTFEARFARGAGRPLVKRLPYFPERAQKRLSGYAQLILAGATAPTAFFAYPDRPVGVLPENCRRFTLASAYDDVTGALQALAEALNAGPDFSAVEARPPETLPSGAALNIESAGAVLGALLPENAIVSDESGTSGEYAFRLTAGAPPHDWLCLTGGAIGQGVPVATGAALACPERKVISLQGDGGAMYTLQALWTQAREQLDVVTLIFSNRKYLILQVELQRLGFETPDAGLLDLMDLARPDLDWVKLAQGMGVSASRAETGDGFQRLLARALAERGPHLIEVVLQ